MGVNYVGRIAVTKNGRYGVRECIPWKQKRRLRRIPKDGTDHFFCRNPDGDSRGPWCYVKENFQSRLSYIGQCDRKIYKKTIYNLRSFNDRKI